LRRAWRGAAESDEVAKTTVSSGFGLTLNGGLSITIGEGSSSNLALRGELPFDYTFDVEASKDTWISFDLDNEAVVQRAYTTPSSEPDLDATEIMLWKIVAGAAAITSTSDERDLQQSILGASIDGNSITSGKLAHSTDHGSVVPNGDFTVWSPPLDDQSVYPPDGWGVDSFTAAGVRSESDSDLWASSGDPRVFHSNTYTQKNNTSLFISCDGSSLPGAGAGYPHVGAYMLEHVPIDSAHAYMLTMRFYASAAVASSLRLAVHRYDKNDALLGTTVYGLPTPSVGWNTYNQPFHWSGAVTRAAVSVFQIYTANVDLHIDYIYMSMIQDRFFAYRNSNKSIAATTWTDYSNIVGSIPEDYDYGKNFDPSAGNATFTTKYDSVWSFRARARWNSIAASDQVELGLYLNGAPATGEQIANDVEYNSTGGAAVLHTDVSIHNIQLSAGDTVEPYVYWHDLGAAGGTTVLGSSGSPTPNSIFTTYFTGIEVKEK
jgi:hypothetical protein